METHSQTGLLEKDWPPPDTSNRAASESWNMYVALWCEASSWGENFAHGLLGFREECHSRGKHQPDNTAWQPEVRRGGRNWKHMRERISTRSWSSWRTAWGAGAESGRPMYVCAAPVHKYFVSCLTPKGPSARKHPHSADAQWWHHSLTCLGEKLYFNVGTVVHYKSHCESSTK